MSSPASGDPSAEATGTDSGGDRSAPGGDSPARRGDPGYERLREGAVFNGRTPARFPELIAQPASEHEVAQLVRHASETGLRVSVRSGGHHWSCPPLRDGALLIDLSRLQQCDVDPGSATATVGPAVTGGVLAERLAGHGLAFPTGHCPDVALGGYLLGGGLGWNGREAGPACRYVEEVRAVTAEGRVVTCSERENPDLFWAARGAGAGFFAVATCFRLRLLPQPGSIMTACLTFPVEEVERAGAWAVRTARESPPNVETSLVLTASGSGGQGDGHGPQMKVETSVFAATPEEAAAALAPVDACPFAVHALEHTPARRTSFRHLYAGRDTGSGDSSQSEQRYAVDTLWSPETYETQIARSARLIADAPSRSSLVLVPVDPVARDPEALRNMAFSAPGDSYVVPMAVWDDPADDDANVRWLREAMDTLDPHVTGSRYVGEADLGAATPPRPAYTRVGLDRLRRLRESWDPEGLFHVHTGP